MLLRSLRIRRWQAAWEGRYQKLAARAPEPERLRLILGVGRSGTSWVSEVLFQTAQRARRFSEPLFHMTPRLPFHNRGDHTAVKYEEMPADHPLLLAYGLLAHRSFDGSHLNGAGQQDPDWEICLIKEVHALLGSESLLRAWGTPVVFILRDPIYALDSLFAAQGLHSIYLDHEVEAVQAGGFLERFKLSQVKEVRRLFTQAARAQERPRILRRKLLCIHLLQEMFSTLAAEFPIAKTARYEQLCESPGEAMRSVAAALAIPWDRAMGARLAKTTQADATSNDPYSVVRNTGEQTRRPFKFLSADEARFFHSLLESIGSDRSGASG